MSNKSLSFKIYLSISVLFLLIFITAIYSIFMINKTQDYSAETETNWLPSINSAQKMQAAFSSISRRPLRIILEISEEERKNGYVVLNKSIENFLKEKKNYEQFISDPDEKKAYESLNNAWIEFSKILDKTLDETKKGLKQEAFKTFNNEGRPFQLIIEKSLLNIAEINNKGAIESTKKGKNLTFLTSITMSIILVIAITILIIIFRMVYKTTSSIDSGIKELKIQSYKIKEIGILLNKSSKTLSESVSNQAASVHETTAAINEITSMVNRTSENSKESTQIAQQSSEKSVEGEKIIKELVNSMESIQESNSQLQNISVIINQIHTKTAVINDIVSKTELLSLNASIESARAGEHGKGFAVVAEEVGNLAKVSGKSALEIQQLITSSQEQVNKILSITKERIDEGKKVTGKAQEIFHLISKNINLLANSMRQISDATREQEIGVRQISTAMEQIDKVTQKSQESSQITSVSSENVSEQSEKLELTSKKIETLINGKAT
ncbi:HAMP domain-containing methyl-accepting chemotaxis protein [Silvanigrella aquatica]|uniref:Methyl-accepting transducer domain-containing protein n=1 Tax=Silvanigrella aquatica TaxID=1915309 RepID=A0A1L4CZR7_9BACT|nr:methyl-accepting chemotaxis protein [Silvanigrella aquatica]APJ03441.1 hypothetical protein AXG55_05785 [Silvanigrella aquatica]